MSTPKDDRKMVFICGDTTTYTWANLIQSSNSRQFAIEANLTRAKHHYVLPEALRGHGKTVNLAYIDAQTNSQLAKSIAAARTSQESSAPLMGAAACERPRASPRGCSRSL
jgi:hypothetical protein